MGLSENQKRLYASLVKISDECGEKSFAFYSEWLGYLPFGQYKRMETAGGVDITKILDCDFDESDLLTLATAGLISITTREVGSPDDLKLIFKFLETDSTMRN